MPSLFAQPLQGPEAAIAVISQQAFDRLRPPVRIEKAAEEQVKIDYFNEQLEEKLAVVRSFMSSTDSQTSG